MTCYYLVMPKHTYRVEWNGATVSRKTDRVYTFVTVSSGKSLAAETAEIARDIKNQRENAAYYLEVVEGKRNGSGTRISGKTEQESYFIWYGQALERIAKLEAEEASDRADRVCEWGWSSRRDLAEKNAAKARDLGYQNVTVLEVPQP
jgi:hypothetical protein